jgi:PAS domain S-box-containing protein
MQPSADLSHVHAMNRRTDQPIRKWNERSSADNDLLTDSGSMFQLLFERSADAILPYDPRTNIFVDCNDAAVEMMRAGTKERLLRVSLADLAPPVQPGCRSSRETATEIAAHLQQNGSHRFEWIARRLDGTDLPLEILATAIPVSGRMLHVVVPRDITERKRAEAEARELNSTLERRIEERAAQLRASEARLRTLVEHAPEAIVVFDGQTGRFLSGNAHACRMYGRSAEELLQLSPAEVSPEFQADGRRSDEVAREKMDQALAGGAPVFEWIHRHATGRLIPTEVRLVCLTAGS